MHHKILVLSVIALLVVNLVLAGAYFYFQGYISIDKAIENGLDFVLGVASGGEKTSIPAGVVLETKGSDGLYLYSLNAKVINLNLNENSLLVETKKGKLLKFGIKERITQSESGLQLSVFERTVKDPMIKANTYILSSEEQIQSQICKDTFVTISWTDKRPLGYWQNYINIISSDSLIEIPNIILNFMKNYNIDEVFKKIDMPSTYTCI